MELQIQLKSYNNQLLNNFCNKFFSSKLAKFSVYFRVRGPIALPKKKSVYTVIRSPHVYSLSRERFSMHTYRRLVVYRLDHNFVLVDESDPNNAELYDPFDHLINEGRLIRRDLRTLKQNVLKKLPVGVSVKFIFKDVS